MCYFVTFCVFCFVKSCFCVFAVLLVFFPHVSPAMRKIYVGSHKDSFAVTISYQSIKVVRRILRVLFILYHHTLILYLFMKNKNLIIGIFILYAAIFFIMICEF